MHAQVQPGSDTVDFPRIVVDEVTIDPTSRLRPADRAALSKALSELSEAAAPEWAEKISDSYVRRFLGDRGYFKAQPEVSAVPIRKGDHEQHVSLKITPNEGPQFRMGKFAVRSADPAQPLAFPSEQIEHTLNLREGDIFNASRIAASLGTLHGLYASNGYIDFVATPIIEVDKGTHELDLTYELDQGAQFHVGTVAIETASDEARSAIRAAVATGTVFTVERLSRVLSDNAALLPADVSLEDVDMDRHVNGGTVDLTFHLNPCPNQHN